MTGLIERVDRMQLVVRDRAQAAATFATMLGAHVARESASECLNAARTVMSLGESELELCQPRGPGLAQTHLDRWGEGLMCAGYAARDVAALAAHLDSIGAAYLRDGVQLHIPGTTTAGFPMVISPLVQRPRAPGPISFFYEATNTLETDWREAARTYVRLFALDASRFSDIASDKFGYKGTLTLFDPPARLDRIELSQTFADKPSAMRRFVDKRGGDSLYMCYVEAHDFEALKRRLMDAGATLTPREGTIENEHDGLWVHPKNLHGLLLGVSRTTVGWEWSGRPDLVRPA